jgi:hypothetical protein
MSFNTRVDRLQRQMRRQTGPIFMVMVGDPEVRRLKDMGQLAPLAMVSDREGMIGRDYYAAAPDETTEAFHARLKQIARECDAFFIMLGHQII